MNLKETIREIPDFPKPGISFKDITTLLKNPEALRYTVDQLSDHFKNKGIDTVVGVESRGFLFGAPLAYKLGAGFVLVRKPGKLPAETLKVEYDLEYGTDALEIHTDALRPGQKVILVDDLLATGGTISAAAELVKRLGADIQGIAFVIELLGLNGRDRLKGYEVFSLVQYDEK